MKAKSTREQKTARFTPGPATAIRAAGVEHEVPQADAVNKNPSEELITPEDRLKASDLLNFTSAIFVIICTAILYFSGWIYMSAWYGFYGINLAQVQISTEVFLVYGIPAVIVTAIVICLSIIPTMIIVGRTWTPKKENKSVQFMVLFSCLFSFCTTFLIASYAKIFTSNKAAIQYVLTSKPTIAFRWITILLLFLVLCFMLANFIDKSSKGNAVPTPSNREDRSQVSLYLDSLNIPWQFWMALLFIVCSLTTTIVTWQLGIIDAYNRTHLMNGDLDAADVNLYSGMQISALEEVSLGGNNSTGFMYGPLFLVHSDQSAYYLSNPNSADRFASGPKVYVIPKTDSVLFSIQTKDWFTPRSNGPELVASPAATITATATLSVKSTPSQP